VQLSTTTLRPLTWAEDEVPQGERTIDVHGLHPYLGKFIPQLVRPFLTTYFTPNEVVFDPFVGSGTTLVEACRMGYRSYGVDIAPFNALLCRVKTAFYKAALVERECETFIARVAHRVANGGIERPRTPWIDTWYDEETSRQLRVAAAVADSWDGEYPDLMKVIVSRAARSARRAPHYELDFPKAPVTEPYWCFKHSPRRVAERGTTREEAFCKPTSGAMGFLEEYTEDCLRRVKEFGYARSTTQAYVTHGNILSPYSVPNQEFAHGIICSPPYPGNIDYHEQHAYFYELFGVERHDALEIGPKHRGNGKAARARYVDEMKRAFANALRAVYPQSPVIVVANDRLKLYHEIRDSLLVDPVEEIEREVNRRTGMRGEPYSETVFVWRKKGKRDDQHGVPTKPRGT
jgi:hypothetical protein